MADNVEIRKRILFCIVFLIIKILLNAILRNQECVYFLKEIISDVRL